MKRLIKTLGTGLLIGLSALSVRVSADSWCWDSCRWDGCWELGAEALYWKPCSCGWEYGIRADQESNATEFLTLNSDYDWGFRIFAGYNSCDACSFLTLDWIYLRTTDSLKKTAGDQETLTIVNLLNVTNADMQRKFDYNRVNLRGGYFLYRGCDLSFYALAGIRWLEIEERRHIDARGTTEVEGPWAKSSRFWGVGVEMGFGAEYDIACGISLVGQIAGTTAVGTHSYRLKSEIPGGFTFTDTLPNDTSCVPGFDLRLGFAYTYDCRCLSLTGEIGYESNYYFNALATQQTRSTGTVTSCEDVGFAGPYVSLKVRF